MVYFLAMFCFIMIYLYHQLCFSLETEMALVVVAFIWLPQAQVADFFEVRVKIKPAMLVF